jgi:LysR family transcriptional regulator, glycine cleavage system transcriptional activator
MLHARADEANVAFSASREVQFIYNSAMRKLPPLSELRAFEAAARHLSFKKAAEELSVTATAISHQVRLLEEFCGAPLFRRRPRPLKLTPAGERLQPLIREGFDGFVRAFSMLVEPPQQQPLVVTTTNAFASRWLVPHLPSWRASHAEIDLEIIGTDTVLDLERSEADIAIRYMFAPPPHLSAIELFRDRFVAVCSPDLLPRRKPLASVRELRGYPLIHCWWSPLDPRAPTWERWLGWMRGEDPQVPPLDEFEHLRFREELHMIDAAVGGLGVGLCGDLLVARELQAGTLIRAVENARSGYGYYLVSAPEAPRRELIDAFALWVRSLQSSFTPH